ncbi:MAG TPA: RecX family transcriptional regulator, partial [Bacteroidota bacterium]|nr:RecX family transcriptional regulator [Bacteroidota bacterium]
DGEFLIGVGAETLIRFGLRTGDEITAATVRSLEEAEELLAAKSAALRLLSVRPRAEREMRDRLREKEFSAKAITEAIDSLKAAKLLDDAQFAEAYIRNALALKPTGPLLLKKKLLHLGVDSKLIKAALAEGGGRDNDEAEAMRAALGFLSRSARSKRQIDIKGLRGRLTAYLLRRGYTWEVVRVVAREAMKEPKGGEEEFPEE